MIGYSNQRRARELDASRLRKRQLANARVALLDADRELLGYLNFLSSGWDIENLEPRAEGLRLLLQENGEHLSRARIDGTVWVAFTADGTTWFLHGPMSRNEDLKKAPADWVREGAIRDTWTPPATAVAPSYADTWANLWVA